MTSVEKIAKMIGCPTALIADLEKKMEKITGKREVMDKIMEENKQRIDGVFRALGIQKNARASEIFDALVFKIENDTREIIQNTGQFSFILKSDCDKLGRLLEGASGHPTGFFLKMDKAREFLIKEPPKKTMAALGYNVVEEMLEKEDILEIYASLRFVEDSKWLNDDFFKQYESLKPFDFEKREIICRGLDLKWAKAAEKFGAKKHHNISHLKELGLIFIIPIQIQAKGEFLRNFSLLLHYIHEIKFYSDIFKGFSETEETFAENFISSLKGDLPQEQGAETSGEKIRWLIIQRYLAKDDPSDRRLFIPHLNPEAIHWYKAEEDLARIALKAESNVPFMEFWKDLDWVGDYFSDPKNDVVPSATSMAENEKAEKELISFNLVDTAMALVKEQQRIKYLYHHKEALWNKIFIEYFSKSEMETIIKKNWLKGYIEF